MNLSIQNISKKYGRKLPVVLSDFSLEIVPGGVLAVVGPVGAGKSTLLEILTTDIKPTSGVCLLDGVNIHKKRDKYSCGHVLDNVTQRLSKFPPDWTIARFLDDLVGASDHLNMNDANEMLRIVGLDDARGVPLAGYSGGMYKRFGMLLALWSAPDVLILDELFTGLDPEIRGNLTTCLKNYAKTHIVVFATDIIADIESMAANVAVLDKGKLVFSGTAETFTKDTGGDMQAAYAGLMDFEVTKV
ncbi:MAG: ABC transporter ATP-binding protein [Oscillospiraceae bacterium]|nr:ABC transporter ATP-binding protein [Oscillospiraceae bacterium]